MIIKFCGVIETTLQWHHNEQDGVSNHQRLRCLLNCWFRRRSKKTSKLRVTGLCVRNSPMSGEVPAQRASNVEKVSVWWRLHGSSGQRKMRKRLINESVQGPLSLTWFNFNARMDNNMPGNVWDEISYPFPNVSGCTVEVWKWIRSFIPHLIMDIITIPCWDIRTLHDCPSHMNENLLISNSKLTSDSELIWWR